MGNYFIVKEKVRFQHIDYAGIVFYPRFLEMLNGIVEDWFEEALDRPFSKMHSTNGIPTVDLKVQFRKAARLGEILTKKLWVKAIGGASLVCGFRFEDEQGNTTLEGEVTLVNIEFNQEKNAMKATPFSEEMRNKIANYELKITD